MVPRWRYMFLPGPMQHPFGGRVQTEGREDVAITTMIGGPASALVRLRAYAAAQSFLRVYFCRGYCYLRILTLPLPLLPYHVPVTVLSLPFHTLC